MFMCSTLSNCFTNFQMCSCFKNVVECFERLEKVGEGCRSSDKVRESLRKCENMWKIRLDKVWESVRTSEKMWESMRKVVWESVKPKVE